jgi:putative ABC transport system permease protein
MDPREPLSPEAEAIDAELEFHFAETVEALIERGWEESAARIEAERRFGDRVRCRRDLEKIHRRGRQRRLPMNDVTSPAMRVFRPEALVRDVRYALRTLARSPGFTIAVVLTLALGIGANGAVFSAVNTVLLQPLPFPDADRLVRIRQVQERSAEANIAPVRLEDWHRLNHTFAAISGYYMEDASETSGEFPERVRRAFVAPRFIEVWGVHPARGRGFTALEHAEAGPRGVLISDRYWRVRLGADPNVLSRTVRIGTAAFSIVGVMPASFRFPDRAVDLWFPIALDNKYAQSRRSTWYTGIGRLQPGVTLQQARADLAAVQAQLGQQYPDSDRTIGVQLVPLKDFMLGNVGRSLWLLLGGVSIVLLITCTNIAGLLLSRSTHRHQEIAVRLSLGASRSRIAVQLLVETSLLSLAGASVGLAVAGAATVALRSMAADLPRMDEITINRAVVLYTFVIAVVVTALCGVLPAFRAGRDAAGRSLTESTRTQVSPRHALQWLLVGAQVAMSVVLLAGAGLLVRSVQELARIDAGFDPARVLTFRVSGNFSETVNYDRLTARIDDTIDAMRALPGVDAAATSLFLPGVPSEFEHTFTLIEARSDAARQVIAERRFVSPEYFETMHIPVVEGELCARQPRNGPRLVLVNQAFRSRYLADWPSPIGLHLAASKDLDQAARIVAVTGDARDHGIDRDPVPTVYACNSTPNPTPHFLLRTQGDPLALAQTVRVTMRKREPLRSVYDIAPLEDRIGGAFAQNRLRTNVLSFFALTALALSGVGLYGTLNYVVNLRRREVGLRLALGAMRTTIVRQFFVQGFKVIAIGCAAGVGLALMVTRLLEGMLFGVSPTDPTVMAAVIAIVMGVAIVGSLVPAVRASTIEPMRVLRDE